MSNCENNQGCNEPAWIRSFMDLTGVTEAQARSVFIYVCCQDGSAPEAAAGAFVNYRPKPANR
jgi:hypothetical protein